MKNNSLIYGKGINDAPFKVSWYETVNGVRTRVRHPCYNVWIDMLKRCYDEKYLIKFPSYRGCVVCDEWLSLKNFSQWMENQDFVGKQLDKDLLYEGNKVYSPDTCIFVSGAVNSFVLDCAKRRGSYSIGVTFNKKAGRFMARCMNPFTKKKEYLGLFVLEKDAFTAWCKKKKEHALNLRNIGVDDKTINALITRYEHIQENEYERF